MSEIKYGKDIETMQELQNVATVLIFRNNIFTVEKVVNQVKQFLITSEFKITDEEIEKMIRDSLEMFEKNGLLLKKGEVYVTLAQMEKTESKVTIL